jgi:hypothetical protein
MEVLLELSIGAEKGFGDQESVGVVQKCWKRR